MYEDIFNSDDRIKNKRRKITTRGLSGLTNIGNTCYMNSILQCFGALDKFRSYLLNQDLYKKIIKNNITSRLAEKERKRLNLTKKDNVPILKRDIDSEYENSITMELGNILKEMWNENNEIELVTFKKILGKKNSQFGGYRQQDSEELLTFILSEIHEELSRKTKVKFPNTTDKIRDLIKIKKECLNLNRDDTILENDEIKMKANEYWKSCIAKYPNECTIVSAYVHWDDYISKGHSYITQLFGGLFYSELKCNDCNYISKIFEPFTSISLPVNEDGKETLEDCLINFSKEEEMTGKGQFKCDNCKKQVEGTKRMYIFEPPEILILHLKKFKRKNNGITFEKSRSLVDFPITGLKLDETYTPIHIKKNYVYDLKAVSKHMGSSIRSGHYVAYCNNSLNDKWYKFDDNHVNNIEFNTEEELKRIIQYDAYVLFYVKR